MRVIIFFLILLLGAVAAALTATAHRLLTRKHKRAGWYLALIGAVGAGLIAFFASESSNFLFFVVHPNDDGHWGHLTESNADAAIAFALVTSVAAVPAFLVVRHLRKQFSSRRDAYNSILKIVGAMSLLALLILHLRDDLVHVDGGKWHSEETIGDVIRSAVLLLSGAILLTYGVVRYYRKRYPNKRQVYLRAAASMGLILTLTALLFHYRELDNYRCDTCFTSKYTYQWRFGLWRYVSIPLSRKIELVRESQFCKDFIPSDHKHTWDFKQSSSWRFFGKVRSGFATSDTSYRMTPLFHVYEGDPKFRAFVQEKLQNGSLTEPHLVMLLSLHLDLTWDDSPEQKEAEALLLSYH